MITKLCRNCKCIIEYPSTYCSECKDSIDKEREEAKAKYSKEANKKYNRKRDPKYIKFYNSPEWKLKLAPKYMADKGYRCEDCGAIASEVHHIKPIQTDEGWEQRLDYFNLKALCLDCHNEEHNRFKRNVRRKSYL
ncbi:HNH endonuclease [Romboutsia ilealis]|nr:HNH endonuclease [Romboutsia ilealis]